MEMRFTGYTFVATFLVLLAACGGAESKRQIDGLSSTEIAGQAVLAKRMIEQRLVDPESTVYRNVKVYRHPNSGAGVVFCGEVNARNRFGGMSGYERFVATHSLSVLESMGKREFQAGWSEFCTSARYQEDAAWF